MTDANHPMVVPTFGAGIGALLNCLVEPTSPGGYVAKYTHNGQTVYAVKRSAPNWKASYRKSHINILYRNGELSAIENDAFSIEKTFDFYAINNTLFIASKRAFESVLEHRKSYTAALGALTATPQFVGLFTLAGLYRDGTVPLAWGTVAAVAGIVYVFALRRVDIAYTLERFALILEQAERPAK